ncbi:hypothetical protein BDY24DRAFT_333138, partial [Mrakia frigida]|uniref:uncharacterized protein n=1 Tax=Mrakia frigida TaxID=29902 RepID=UPI003FCBF69F
MSSDLKKKQLVFNILGFLRDSVNDNSIKSDDAEGVEVAIECIAEAFGIDPTSASQQEQYSIKPASLLSLLDVYLRTKEKSGVKVRSHLLSSSSSLYPAALRGSKAAGNSLMTTKQYSSAIEKYTEAIALDARNPVYYSNRAAAYSSAGDHHKAVEDAEKALEVDSSFVKAYSRLGHAHYSLSQFPSAVQAYEKGLLLDPTNTNLRSALANAQSPPPMGGMPDLSALAGMFGGGAGGAGGGGMPDIASLMQNPQLMAMAQQMMASGGLDGLMNNPTVRNMAERMQSGGGPPSMSEMMNDPSLREMA